MDGAAQNWSFTAWLRDRAYDTVFYVGDTALQFTADLIRGPDNARHEPYMQRQLGKQERKNPPEIKKNAPEKPLNFSEKQAITQMLRRRSGESIIEHWKRRKELLYHPDKRQLIATEQKIEAEGKKDRSIRVERKTITSDYQQNRLRKAARTRKRGR